MKDCMISGDIGVRTSPRIFSHLMKFHSRQHENTLRLSLG